MTASRSVVRILCLALLLFVVAGSRVASATHFIAGTLFWERDLSYQVPTEVKVRVHFDGSFRWSFPWTGYPPQTIAVGNTIADEVALTATGTNYNFNFPVLLVVNSVLLPPEDRLSASGSVDLIIPVASLPVTVQFGGCCRASELSEANNDRNYFLTTVIDTTNGSTRSPRSTSSPRVVVLQNVPNTIFLPTVAFDNFVNIISFAPPADSGLVTPRPNGTQFCTAAFTNNLGCPDLQNNSGFYAQSMQLSPNGSITWTPQLTGIYSAQFRITSVDPNTAIPKSSIPFDMEFVVTAPQPTPLPTIDPATPPSLLAPAGQPASFTLTVSSNTATPGDYATLSNTPLPPGATFTQTDQSPTNTANYLFSWTPTLADIGNYSFCVQAIAALPLRFAAGQYCIAVAVVSGVLCEAGSYSASGYTPCTLAPPGSFVASTGSTSWTPCAAGTFSSVAGAVACTPAPAGSFVFNAGSLSATLCFSGTFSSAPGATICTFAPAGSFASGNGNIAATLCPAGTFSSAEGAAQCTSAPPGSFVSGTGSTSATLAPAGSFAAGPGATSATLCPAGTFSGAAGAAACTPAPAGSFVSGTGSTSATLCAAGTFSSTAGAPLCTPAPAGSFVSGTGGTAATPCPAGTFSSGTGATACTSAPAGSFASGTGNVVATLCPPGTFSSAAGQAACTLAPAGSFASGPGATSATLCAAGKFSSTAGAALCTPAPAGSFVSGTGSTAATPCPAGTFSSGTGATSCTLAPAGSFASGTGNVVATLCPPGSFSSAAGAAACTLAPAGTFVAGSGATSATPCPAGTTSSAGASACTPVAALLNAAIDAALSGSPTLANVLHKDVDAIVAANGGSKPSKVKAFIRDVEKMRGNPLTNAQADNLIALAQLL